MAGVILRQKAIDDLNDIWNYTFEQWSEVQADQYYAALKSACEEIGLNPRLGKKYTEISRNLLGLKVGRHIIFYQLGVNNAMEVVRILHGRMDLKNRLSE